MSKSSRHDRMAYAQSIRQAATRAVDARGQKPPRAQEAVNSRGHRSLVAVEPLEGRTLFAAAVVAPDPVILGDMFSSPLPARPGHSIYVSNLNSTGSAVSATASSSAITPAISGDLLLG